MNLYISFSARKDGNCDEIAKFLAKDGDRITYFRNMNVHGCANCDYECFSERCKYDSDDAYALYESMNTYQKVVLIVPTYCGNPSSLYFVFNERSQDYFMRNEEKYENILKRLFIIGIYGSHEESPDFIPCFEKWFVGSKYSNHVLGIERRKYDVKLKDSLLAIEEIKNSVTEFIHPSKATDEISAMAVVLRGENILATNESIYGRATLSLPKGHQEENEALIDTAVRECFEETNVAISKDEFVKELQPFSYEFVTPSNKLIRKTVVPFLFQVENEGNPIAKEKRMLSVNWMRKEDFLRQCTHKNVKTIVESI